MKKYNVSKNNICDDTHFNSLQKCFDAIEGPTIIYLEEEEYFGKLYLDKPDVHIIGKNSIINYDVCHKTIIRDEDGGDGIKIYGTSGSASFTILERAINFKMEGVTIKNSFVRDGKKGVQAVAFKTNAIKGTYHNCRFIGGQDTLYVENDDNYFLNCHIEGDVDFIFGGGSAVFDSCNIKPVLMNKENAYITAPSTLKAKECGFLFYKCNIEETKINTFLGRPWFPSISVGTVTPKCLFWKCKIPSSINLSFCKMKDDDPDYWECYVDDSSVSGKYLALYEKIKKERLF